MEYGDYLVLVMLDGVLHFLFNLGSGEADISSVGTVELNVWHTAVIYRSGSVGGLVLDDMAARTGTSPPPFTGLNVASNFYLGGLPGHLNVTSVAGTSVGFTGCIGALIVDGVKKDLIVDAMFGYGVGECGFTFCSPNPCLNGGTCVEMTFSYACQCMAGFTGPSCSSLQDPCKENPSLCAEGATCISGNDGISYTCLCPLGSGGDQCENGMFGVFNSYVVAIKYVVVS